MATWSKEVFSANLQYYMGRKGISQKELAEIVGVSAPTLNEWIKSKKYPRIDKIEKLANYFGCLKSDLIEEKEKQPTAKDDELSENMKQLIEFAKSVPDEKVELVLKVMKSIVEAD